jgi:hypothetical protein
MAEEPGVTLSAREAAQDVISAPESEGCVGLQP